MEIEESSARKAIRDGFKKQQDQLDPVLQEYKEILPGFLVGNYALFTEDTETRTVYVGIHESVLWVSAKDIDTGETVYEKAFLDMVTEEGIDLGIIAIVHNAIGGLLERLLGQPVLSINLSEQGAERTWTCKTIRDLNAVMGFCPDEDLGELFLSIAGTPFPIDEEEIAEGELIDHPLGILIIKLLYAPLGTYISEIKESKKI